MLCALTGIGATEATEQPFASIFNSDSSVQQTLLTPFVEEPHIHHNIVDRVQRAPKASNKCVKCKDKTKSLYMWHDKSPESGNENQNDLLVIDPRRLPPYVASLQPPPLAPLSW